MEETIKNLGDLFKKAIKLKVPSYQRAYAWEEEQLSQFIYDMLEMVDNGDYYYGHFILEETNDGFEIIDGQQRLTTFILFLIVCRLFKGEGFEDYIDKFETVDYDREAFEVIQKKLNDTNAEWNIKDFEIKSEQTLSIKRIIFALNHFRKLFDGGKPDPKLNAAKIHNYIKTLTQAHISTHITYDKAIAVQIFELQNTRGIKLNLIEKVKSKLMKAVYINAESEKRDVIISGIQKNFAEIYRLEEAISSNTFRGELSLEDILLHHLRIVDDGAKLAAADKNLFNSPAKHGDKEKSILSYIDTKINIVENSPDSIVKYITELTDNFKKTVQLVSKELPEEDKENHLIGDLLILDKSLSLEFFIMLYYKDLQTSIKNRSIIKLWEKLLFTRDFHDKYYRLKSTDDFEALFQKIALEGKIEDILNYYVIHGFRPEHMEERNLPLTVSSYIKKNETSILNNAFNWKSGKMVYILYKYEISLSADLDELRKIIKEGRSVEHILPREWKWEWIGETQNNVSEIGLEFNKKINGIINGIGNLLLITGSENSSKSNNHPHEKYYKSCSGGSYTIHNENKSQWEEHKNWEKLINERGEKIYDFLKYFIS